jgi:hypothetical protein
MRKERRMTEGRSRQRQTAQGVPQFKCCHDVLRSQVSTWVPFPATRLCLAPRRAHSELQVQPERAAVCVRFRCLAQVTSLSFLLRAIVFSLSHSDFVVQRTSTQPQQLHLQLRKLRDCALPTAGSDRCSPGQLGRIIITFDWLGSTPARPVRQQVRQRSTALALFSGRLIIGSSVHLARSQSL